MPPLSQTASESAFCGICEPSKLSWLGIRSSRQHKKRESLARRSRVWSGAPENWVLSPVSRMPPTAESEHCTQPFKKSSISFTLVRADSRYEPLLSMLNSSGSLHASSKTQERPSRCLPTTRSGPMYEASGRNRRYAKSAKRCPDPHAIGSPHAPLPSPFPPRPNWPKWMNIVWSSM